MVQNRQTGEQMMHWDMLTKPPNLNFPSASFAHQFGELNHVTRSAAKGPLVFVSVGVKV